MFHVKLRQILLDATVRAVTTPVARAVIDDRGEIPDLIVRQIRRRFERLANGER